MGKPSLTSYLRDNLDSIDNKDTPGPYITISREFGCDGYTLGDILAERLNQIDTEPWKVYKKDVLKQLAEETGLAEEMLERERLSKPSLIKEFLRGARKTAIPDGYEIRNKITVMLRTLAFEGHAIIVGQGATAATADLENGISIRVEAPREWRITRVCTRESLSKDQAVAKMYDIEKTRTVLRKLYEQKNPRTPLYDLMFDNSAFTLDQIADMTIFAMKQKRLLPEE